MAGITIQGLYCYLDMSNNTGMYYKCSHVRNLVNRVLSPSGRIGCRAMQGSPLGTILCCLQHINDIVKSLNSSKVKIHADNTDLKFWKGYRWCCKEKSGNVKNCWKLV